MSKSQNLTNSNNQPNENNSNNSNYSNDSNHLQAAAGFGLKSSVPKKQLVTRVPRRQSTTFFTGTQIPDPGNQWISSEKTIYMNQTATHAIRKSFAPGGHSYYLNCANHAQVYEAGVYRVIYKNLLLFSFLLILLYNNKYLI